MSIATIVRSRVTKVGLPLVTAGILAAACSAGTSATSAGAAPATQGAAPATQGAAPATQGAAPATSGATTTSSTTIKLSGGHLTDGAGRTLYLWVVDPTGKSTCYAACASVWPPVAPAGTPTAGTGVDAAKLTTIKRNDGTSQLAYAGHALYYFASDKASGQTTGQGSDGFGAKWWEVNASGQAITTAAGSSSTAPSTTSGGTGY